MDIREDEFIKDLLINKELEIEIQTLSIGDFICSEKTVIERKTKQDLEASIIDGRLFEQLKRLKETFECVILLVEGYGNAERINNNALKGAQVSIMTDYGASLLFTHDKNETAEMIYAIAKHEQIARKQKNRIKAHKKAHTLGEKQRAVIEALPLVGPQLAIDLLETFGTIENIISADEDELAEVNNLGKKKAQLLKNIFESVYVE
ncbi:MAG: ERCC4 domain-containing protein [Candidatus Micrarchaeia archaeon]|jgi:Fanconi anemia group M protein